MVDLMVLDMLGQIYFHVLIAKTVLYKLKLVYISRLIYNFLCYCLNFYF